MSDDKPIFSLITFGDVHIDLKTASKTLNRLVDAVSAGLGKWWEPHHKVRTARADIEVALIRAEGDRRLQDLAARTSARLEYQELQRQDNLEQVVAGAARILGDQQEDTASEQPIDKDWFSQFFTYCQDVSDKQMQSLWSCLLASEVVQPGSFSPRTLLTVRTLRRADADLFTRYCSFVVCLGNDTLCRLKTADVETAMKHGGFLRDRLISLQDLELISPTPSIIEMGAGEITYLYYFGRRYLLRGMEQVLIPRALEIETLTRVGSELIEISGAKEYDNYVSILTQSLRQYGIELVREE